MSIRPTNNKQAKDGALFFFFASTWIRNQRLLCQFKCWLGVYCRAVDQCAPRATVLRQVAPPLHVLLPAENRRDARLLERLVQRVPVRELGSPVGPRVADPRGEELARKSLVACGTGQSDLIGPYHH